jgi:hypothetical protein
LGEAQIVATSDSIVLDLRSRIYDISGHLHRDHALAHLSVATAIRLRELLGEAIEASLDAWQTGTSRASGAMPRQPMSRAGGGARHERRSSVSRSDRRVG